MIVHVAELNTLETCYVQRQDINKTFLDSKTGVHVIGAECNYRAFLGS